ncbi:MAG TPA: hypothetical protein VE395_01580 [Acidimicrobiales bacterium]|nr:hypothetical protein [Acidimicrobiales bacterium]
MLTAQTPEAPATPRAQGYAALALLSLGAGFLHAAVINAHEGHGLASELFTAAAIFQVAWAGLVLAKPSRGLLALGALVNAAFVGGWVLNRTSGISFIDGFQDKEPVGFTDGVTVALEVLLVVGVALLLRPAAAERPARLARLSTAGLGLMGLAVALFAVPAAAAGGDHPHEEEGAEAAAGHHGGGHGDGDAEVHGHDEADGHEDPSTATAEQRAAADELLQDTKTGFWQWTDDQRVHEAGFRSIGDGVTGTEHLVNWNWINDDTVLDPDHPESLVYNVGEDGKRTLAAAMYMAPAGTPDDEVPDVGGPITQWHIHNNLCYSPATMVDGAPQRRVVGLTRDGTCRPGGEFLSPHAPMLHVWVVEHECGPFSSLEGVGAGQAIREEQDPNAPVDCQHSEHA